MMMNKTTLLALFALLSAACLEAGSARKRIDWSLRASELAVGNENRPLAITKKFKLLLERPGWFQPSHALDATFTELGDDCVAVKFTVPDVAPAADYHLRLKRRFAWFMSRSYNPSPAFAIVKSDIMESNSVSTDDAIESMSMSTNDVIESKSALINDSEDAHVDVEMLFDAPETPKAMEQEIETVPVAPQKPKKIKPSKKQRTEVEELSPVTMAAIADLKNAIMARSQTNFAKLLKYFKTRTIVPLDSLAMEIGINKAPSQFQKAYWLAVNEQKAMLRAKRPLY